MLFAPPSLPILAGYLASCAPVSPDRDGLACPPVCIRRKMCATVPVTTKAPAVAVTAGARGSWKLSAAGWQVLTTTHCRSCGQRRFSGQRLSHGDQGMTRTLCLTGRPGTTSTLPMARGPCRTSCIALKHYAFICSRSPIPSHPCTRTVSFLPRTTCSHLLRPPASPSPPSPSHHGLCRLCCGLPGCRPPRHHHRRCVGAVVYVHCPPVAGYPRCCRWPARVAVDDGGGGPEPQVWQDCPRR